MCNFKEGDKVERIKDEWYGMKIGDQGIIEKITSLGGLRFAENEGGHDPDSFKLVKDKPTLPKYCIGEVFTLNKDPHIDSNIEFGKYEVVKVFKDKDGNFLYSVEEYVICSRKKQYSIYQSQIDKIILKEVK